MKEINEENVIRTIKTYPKEKFVGHWKSGRLYPLYNVVENNGSKFVSLNGKMKAEPYVVYNSTNGSFSANEGWAIKEMSADSRISAMGSGASPSPSPSPSSGSFYSIMVVAKETPSGTTKYILQSGSFQGAYAAIRSGCPVVMFVTGDTSVNLCVWATDYNENGIVFHTIVLGFLFTANLTYLDTVDLLAERLVTEELSS